MIVFVVLDMIVGNILGTILGFIFSCCGDKVNAKVEKTWEESKE